jgi:integrase
MTVARKVVEVSGHGMVEGATKTRAGRRTVTLPRAVVAEVVRHRERFAGTSSSLVFTTQTGDQVRANNLRRREWAAAAIAAGLGGYEKRADGKRHYVGITFHDMRHTAVSLWVAAGASALAVAKWAGHRSAAFTKSRYAHLFPEHGASLAKRLDAFITSSTPTPADAA